MTDYNVKEKIVEHYDLVSPYYHSLWGEHLHHGFWVTGKETKEEAQLALTKHLAQTTGITISPVQVEMAQKAAQNAGVNSRFVLMDAEEMNFTEPFDVIWSIESISHYKNRRKFFEDAAKLLAPHGIIAITDWFKKENLSKTERQKYISPIEKGMMVELNTMKDYISTLEANKVKIFTTEDISQNVAKTWDITLDIIKSKALWELALRYGEQFISFFRAFQAMKSGFSSGNLVYGLIVGKKL